MRLISHSSSMPDCFAHAPAHRLAELLDLAGGGLALVDEEIAMELATPSRIADGKAAQARAVDQLPGLACRAGS